MPGHSIQNQQHLVGRPGNEPSGGAADLLQLSHEARLIVQAPGSVGDHGVYSPSLGRLQGIVNHGARVSAGLLANHRTAGPLAPDDELLRGSGPKRVSGAQQNLATLASQAMRELADGSGLAHSVHAYHQNDLDGRFPGLGTGIAVGLAQDL